MGDGYHYGKGIKMRNAVRMLLPMLLVVASVMAEDIKPIELPKPDMTGGKPLMQVLADRQSSREFSADTLSLPVLSNLLWAACGVSRPESGKRTAPSARNMQEIDVYVAMAHGLYVYEPKSHTLQPVVAADVREATGMQPFVKDVPVNLIYVADYAKMGEGSENDKIMYSATDAAFISENVYLFCASEGLATVVRGSVEREKLAKAMQLRADQKIILAQSVGHPKE
jgi:SagB-type dehydrogenase family enzyme